jgi:hypothetical protein
MQRRNANATGALFGTGGYLGLILKVRLNKNVLSKILKTLTLRQSLTSSGKLLKTDGAANEIPRRAKSMLTPCGTIREKWSDERNERAGLLGNTYGKR